MHEPRASETARVRWSLASAAMLHVLLLGLNALVKARPHTTLDILSPGFLSIEVSPTEENDAAAHKPGSPPGGNGAPNADRAAVGVPENRTKEARVEKPARPTLQRTQVEHAVLTKPHRPSNETRDAAEKRARDHAGVMLGDNRLSDARPAAAGALAVTATDAGTPATRPESTPFSVVALLESRVGSKYAYGRGDGGTVGPGGSHGGPGGWGVGRGWGNERLATAPIISSPNAFGSGTSGAFTGVVCAIAPGTSSLGSIRDCGQPLGRLFTNEINVGPRRFTEGFPGLSGRTEWFAIEYRGTVRTRREGKYVFRVLSDDGARLVIDGELVVDNDGQHGPTSRWGETWLPAATHAVRIDYYQGPRWDIALQVWVTPPGEQERLLGPVL